MTSQKIIYQCNDLSSMFYDGVKHINAPHTHTRRKFYYIFEILIENEEDVKAPVGQSFFYSNFFVSSNKLLIKTLQNLTSL